MIDDRDLAYVVGRVTALYDPDRIYLFGSYAKGTATDASDLDLIVVRADDLPRRLRGRDVVDGLSGLAIGIDLLFLTPAEVAAELADPYSICSTIMPTARTVYERPAAGGRGVR
ncbi:nucleotidyltransferase domain-containing protein [Dactylosporangium sp. CS-033363]|uniref:nucleotidyltransferase domain-containing protein n=1 Tax=Dactylosporangium sp. CS-033363 TaxID=3239935 RepID=UPI003D91A981